MVKNVKRLYWDTAAATPLDRRVFRAMEPFLTRDFGNPGSLHLEGQVAKRVVEQARVKIAEILSAHPDEIVFNGSGTESDNLALLGLMLQVVLAADPRRGAGPAPRLITTTIEHPAVLAPARFLERLGARVVYLPVGSSRRLDSATVAEALTPETRLVSVMLANNETGSIQPLATVAKVIRRYRRQTGRPWPYLHTDACQAPRFLDLNVAKLGVDLLSFNGSKIYGPKGIGVLYVRRGVPLLPIALGGGQEGGRRSGTLNVAGIVGLAKALALCAESRAKESNSLAKTRDRLAAKLKKIDSVTINGDLTDRLPHNLNFSVVGLSAEQLVLELDAKGIAVSAGSACGHSSLETALGGVRVSLGRGATLAEADYFAKMLIQIITKYQNYQTPGV